MIAATGPELPLRALGAVRREQWLVVLHRHIDSKETPTPRLVVGQQEALLAEQLHGPTTIRPPTVASAFVGHDFAVPPGPTSYKTTISYDWDGRGFAMAVFAIAVSSVDLAIVIDKRDGTRETYAREVSVLTIPVAGYDSFRHTADDARVTIPFSRDGSNGTVRIMVGVEAHCVVTGAYTGGAGFDVSATVREICLKLGQLA